MEALRCLYIVSLSLFPSPVDIRLHKYIFVALQFAVLSNYLDFLSKCLNQLELILSLWVDGQKVLLHGEPSHHSIMKESY